MSNLNRDDDRVIISEITATSRPPLRPTPLPPSVSFGAELHPPSDAMRKKLAKAIRAARGTVKP